LAEKSITLVYSEKMADCDFCPSKSGYLFTIETKNCLQVISACGKCRASKKPEKLDGFMQWLWLGPGHAAASKKEQQGKK